MALVDRGVSSLPVHPRTNFHLASRRGTHRFSWGHNILSLFLNRRPTKKELKGSRSIIEPVVEICSIKIYAKMPSIVDRREVEG